MGWIKSIFTKKEEESLDISVSLEKLPDWFDAKIAPETKKIKEDIIKDFEQINKQKEDLRQKLKKFETTELRNPNIPERARHMMEGARETYIKFITIFLNNLEFPQKISYETLTEFIGNFEGQLNNLNKSTARSFMVLQEFFAKEAGEIAAVIKNIDKTLRDLANTNYKNIISARESIENIEKIIESKDTAQQMLEEHEKNLENINKDVEKESKQLEDLKEREDFKLYETIEKEKLAVEKQLKEKELFLITSFSPLERSLRKFEKMAIGKEAIVKGYAENAFAALKEDKKMEVLEILKDIVKYIELGQIELKDKKKQKTVETATALNRDFLETFLNDYAATESKLVEVKRKLHSNTILQQIDEVNYRIEHLNDKKIKLEENIKKLQSYDKEKEINQNIDTVKKAAKEILNINLTVSI